MDMSLDLILLEIAKMDYVDQQSLSTFLIDLVHTQEQMKKAMKTHEKNESNSSN